MLHEHAVDSLRMGIDSIVIDQKRQNQSQRQSQSQPKRSRQQAESAADPGMERGGRRQRGGGTKGLRFIGQSREILKQVYDIDST